MNIAPQTGKKEAALPQLEDQALAGQLLFQATREMLTGLSERTKNLSTERILLKVLEVETIVGVALLYALASAPQMPEPVTKMLAEISSKGLDKGENYLEALGVMAVIGLISLLYNIGLDKSDKRE